MIMQPAAQLSFAFFDSVPVVVESSAARISSDAGLLPLCQLDEHLGLTRQFAAALGEGQPATWRTRLSKVAARRHAACQTAAENCHRGN